MHPEEQFALGDNNMRIRSAVVGGVAGLLLSASPWVHAMSEDSEDHSYKPLKLNLSEDGKKYVRFLLWHQQWAVTNNLDDDSNFQLESFARRSRVLAYAQISSRFLILTHFGLNNLTPGNMNSFGNNGDASQLFLHDAWGEFKVSDDNSLYIGTGLHYWKGLTRLSNASTLNFMTMDNPRPFVHWHNIGVTDQFARAMGVYAKGELGRFDYRVAVNNPIRNGIQSGFLQDGSVNPTRTYNGFNEPDESGDTVGRMIYEGYFRYQFADKESTKLPYQVGTYLGKKNVMGVGAGFFLHPDGMYNNVAQDHENVSHYALDFFMDRPLRGDDCLNAYASVIQFDYGDDFVSRWAGTGTTFYGHLGYKFPGSKIMPYIALQNADYDGWDETVRSTDIGVNYFLNGHHAKITLEYHRIENDIREGAITDFGDNNSLSQIRLQTHIFL